MSKKGLYKFFEKKGQIYVQNETQNSFRKYGTVSEYNEQMATLGDHVFFKKIRNVLRVKRDNAKLITVDFWKNSIVPGWLCAYYLNLGYIKQKSLPGIYEPRTRLNFA